MFKVFKLLKMLKTFKKMSGTNNLAFYEMGKYGSGVWHLEVNIRDKKVIKFLRKELSK